MENRFIVPQFIDAENKIWGPITIRQFIIVMVGGLFIFLAYKLSDFSLFLLQAFLTVVLTIVFAFYKVNGAPFHLFALNFIETLKKPNIRVWRKEYIKIEVFKSKDEGAATEEVLPRKKMVSSKKLSELSLIIDTGGAYKGESDANKENNLRI